MQLIHIDFETRSKADLKKLGAWAYSLDPTTEIWCMAYWHKATMSEPKIWIPGHPVPPCFNMGAFCLSAHNFAFEEAIWENILIPKFNFPYPELWQCTMAAAMRNNLPASLEALAERLGTQQKDAAGSKLMVKMANAKTYDPTKTGSTAEKNHEANFSALCEYCIQDVIVEDAVCTKLGEDYSPLIKTEFDLDHQINRRGIKVDVQAARWINSAIKSEQKNLLSQITELTDGEVTSARQQAKLLKWLQGQGYIGTDIRAETVTEALRSPGGMTKNALKVLRIRQQSALGSLAKFDVMIHAADEKHRLYNLFQLYGASQTGRWAGRLVQFQNLPRMSISDAEIEMLIQLFRQKQIDTIRMLYGDVFSIAKQLIRPMFTSDIGLVVSDLAQIECRTLAWLTGCQEMLDLFEDPDRDPYSEMASSIYGRPAKDCGKGTDQRQLGKVAILGCGYGMGAERFQQTVKSWTGMEIEEELARHAVDTFRGKFHEIPQYWRTLQNCMIKTLTQPDQDIEHLRHNVVLKWGSCIKLPSGRTLSYPNMRYDKDEEGLTFLNAFDQRTKAYGGKFAENITQAVARDVLAEAMLRLKKADRNIVGHVHDEVILEAAEVDVEDIHQIMISNPSWAKDLPLQAETSFCKRYSK